MIDKYRPEMLHREWKAKLAEAFERASTHPDYVNKTYIGTDFVKALREWVDAWFGIAYDSTDRDVDNYWEKPETFKYKITRWTYWDHEFNRVLWETWNEHNPVPFRCPEFLDGMFDITRRFLEAKTIEEESEVLNTTYRIILEKEVKHYEPNSSTYTSDRTWRVDKYVWLSEENVGTKSRELPCYAPYDITGAMRGRKLYNYYRKHYKHLFNIEDIIKDVKEVWRCYRLAVEKGIMIDNRRKEKE